MVIDWSQSGGREPEPEREPIRAAEYVRMSTEHQQYSTDNQAVAIRRYADQRGYVIVRTYADQGKSGLRLDGRAALKLLLDDVELGRANFDAILVYDVSRWGRFQDPDEAAMYELRCRRAGVDIHYCAEQFENDGTIGSSIIKTVKRAMAGEYSRELSVKVFAGQSNLIRLGYRQGGTPGYGLRRQLLDQQGAVKGLLDRGEHKSITTDRVILVPGGDDETEIVRGVYRDFVENYRTEVEIALALNERGVAAEAGRRWTRGSVHQLLINEKYIGNNVWGRTSFKLKRQHVHNDPSQWVRADGAFEAIVTPALFQAARAMIDARSERLTDDQMLDRLRHVLDGHGVLSGLIIDEVEDCPSSSAFQTRFGSLLRAYAMVGFSPDRDYRYVEINRDLRRMHPDIVREIMAGIVAAGGSVRQDEVTDMLTMNEEVTVAIVVARCYQTAAGSLRWTIRLDESLKPGLTIAVRMNDSNTAPHDYYLLPRLDMRSAVLRLAEHNGLSLDAYRVDTLDSFYRMSCRVSMRRAA
jgi:DNA invertase Pin-like site-specific DNA recombinase